MVSQAGLDLVVQGLMWKWDEVILRVRRMLQWCKA